MAARPRIDTAARRARLVARHHLARTAGDAAAAVTDLVAVHSSDPITPHLALRARVSGFEVADLEAALYRDRTLWRLHGMRRTLFIVAVGDAPTVLTAASAEVARTSLRKLEGWVGHHLGLADPGRHLDALAEQVLTELADGEPRRTRDLAGSVDGLAVRLQVPMGGSTYETPLASHLLNLLAMEGRIVRAQPAGTWLSSQYRWAETSRWFSSSAEPPAAQPDVDAARAELVRRWLRAHGPATTADVRWWTGWGLRVATAALAAVEAVEVDLDGGTTGWVLPDDVETVAAGPAGVALLPVLDPTVMGWKERDWYLGDHQARLFDRNGNAGPTVWVDGRIVGGWAVRDGGRVVTGLLETVDRRTRGLVDAEAAALTDWLAGTTPTPRFRTPLERDLAAS